MVALAFGVFGLITGSFLNVIIFRHGARSIGGRSGCMSCGMQLPWYDMIPVLSWLALGGRCRFCRGRISSQYPLVEAATGTLFALVGASPLLLPQKVLGCAVLALLICVAAYDFKHTIIPDRWVWSFNALAFVFASAFPWHLAAGIPQGDCDFLCLGYSAWKSGALQLALLAGPIAAAPLFAMWLFSRGRWMGLGDGKLALGIGWLLGPALGLLAVFGAFVIGAVVSLTLIFFSSQQWKKILRLFTPTSISQRLTLGFTMKSEIPFGPFLIAACLLVWFAAMYGVQFPFFSLII